MAELPLTIEIQSSPEDYIKYEEEEYSHFQLSCSVSVHKNHSVYTGSMLSVVQFMFMLSVVQFMLFSKHNLTHCN